MSKKYSIIVTAYNAEKYLPICLSSVKRQVYTNWELILVDDGSTDNSKIIEKEFTESVNAQSMECSVKLILNEKNMGAVYSREKGICSATGEYLLFMDSDDWWDDNLIELVDEVITETNADIVQYGYKFKNELGDNVTDCGLYKKGGNGQGKNVIDNDSNSFTYKALSTCYSLWSRAIKRDLFDCEAGYYSQYYDVNMTNDLLAFSRPLSLAKSYCFTDIYPYNYRLLNDSLCHDVSIGKICSYFKSLGWAERCMSNRNGKTEEHIAFFSKRLTNIVFDEYRVYIYSSNILDIKRVYKASDYVENIDTYIKKALEDTRNWYKRLYLESFLKKRVLLPKILYYYSILRGKCNLFMV